jgi:hypothetical protein
VVRCYLFTELEKREVVEKGFVSGRGQALDAGLVRRLFALLLLLLGTTSQLITVFIRKIKVVVGAVKCLLKMYTHPMRRRR